MGDTFIIDFKIKTDHVSDSEFKNLIDIYKQKRMFTKKEMINFFNTIIFLSRWKLLDYSDGSMTNLCDTAQSMIGLALEEIGIPVRVLDIGRIVSKDALGHSILIADVPCENSIQSLLIDITYQQFCLSGNCNQSCYFKKDGYILLSPHPGYFALQNNERKETIKALLEHGYLPWNGLVAKHYCDTFFLSQTGKEEDINTKNYTMDDYLSLTKFSNTNYSKSKDELKENDLWIDLGLVTDYHK